MRPTAAQHVMGMTSNVRAICRDVRKPFDPEAKPELDPQFLPHLAPGDLSAVVRGGSFPGPSEFGHTTDRSEPLTGGATAP